MKRSVYLFLALLLPIIAVMMYSLQSQYRYDDREEFILPVS